MDWISVKDKMPPHDYSTRMLVYGKPTCGTCGEEWQILYCRYSDGYFMFGEYDCTCEASHWMPLPPPPNLEK